MQQFQSRLQYLFGRIRQWNASVYFYPEVLLCHLMMIYNNHREIFLNDEPRLIKSPCGDRALEWRHGETYVKQMFLIDGTTEWSYKHE